MGIVVVPTYGSDPATVTAANLDAKVAGLATEFNGGIDNDNIDASAGIVASKLNLATVAQSVAMSGKDFTEAKGADIASATTCTIWAVDGNFMHITGTTTITSFGTAQQAGDCRTIVFDGVLTLTHNGTSLILPTGANTTTAAGDTAIVRAETTANARVVSYIRANGTPLANSLVAATQADQETATSTTTFVSPGRQQFHPSAAKAWCLFDGTQASPSIAAGLNTESAVTKNGTGDYTISWSTDFSDANYCVVANAGIASSVGVVGIVAILAGAVRVKVTDVTNNNAIDATVFVVAFGDQ